VSHGEGFATRVLRMPDLTRSRSLLRWIGVPGLTIVSDSP